MRNLRALVFVALAIAFSARPGLGNDVDSTVVLTFYGTVTSGVDNEGQFGPAGANLAGQSATVQFSFSRFAAEYTGGFLMGWMSGMATIGGRMTPIPGLDGGFLALSSQSASASANMIDTYAMILAYVSGSVTSGANSFGPPEDNTPSLPSPQYLTRSYSYVLQPGDSGVGSFVGEMFPAGCWDSSCVLHDDLSLDINQVTLNVGAAEAPEPAIWFLLALGLSTGLLAMRRKSRSEKCISWR